MRAVKLVKTEEEPKALPEDTDKKVAKERIWQYIWKVYTGEIDISAS